MRTSYILSLALALLFFFACEGEPDAEYVEKYPAAAPEAVSEAVAVSEPDSLLRHVVLFRFKPEASPEDVRTVEEAFHALPGKIEAIHDYEWGLNNSPEGLNKDFTHAFFLTFTSEAKRDAYLPHPEHKKFGEVLRPHLEDVLVVDYWTK